LDNLNILNFHKKYLARFTKYSPGFFARLFIEQQNPKANFHASINYYGNKGKGKML